MEAIDDSSKFYWAIIEFEKPLIATKGSLMIGSKFDTDITANQCRLAFYGNIMDNDCSSLKVLYLHYLN